MCSIVTLGRSTARNHPPCFSVAVTLAKSNWGREGFVWRRYLIPAHHWREPGQEPWRKAACWKVLSLVCPVFYPPFPLPPISFYLNNFLMWLRITRMDWALLHQLIMRIAPQRQPKGCSNGDSFSVEVPSFQVCEHDSHISHQRSLYLNFSSDIYA